MTEDKNKDKGEETISTFGGFMIALWWLFWFLAIWINEHRIQLVISGIFCLFIALLLAFGVSKE